MEGKTSKEDSMKSLGTMILIAFTMLFASEVKAEIPKQPPAKKKMEESRRKKCARILARIEKVPKPTPEKCAKLQVARVKEEPPAPPAKPVTTKAKAKELPRENAIGFGMVTDGMNMGGILTSEFVLYKVSIVKLGISPKFSYLRGELQVVGDTANRDITVSKFDFTVDFMVKVCPILGLQVGTHVGMGLRSLTNGDVVLKQDILDKSIHGIESGSQFNFLISMAMFIDVSLTKSLRMSVFYRHTLSINQIRFFSVDGKPEKTSAYHDNVGGVMFSILIP